MLPAGLGPSDTDKDKGTDKDQDRNQIQGTEKEEEREKRNDEKPWTFEPCWTRIISTTIFYTILPLIRTPPSLAMNK